MPDDSAEPLSDDAYLERIDDRINWRLTHCNLPVADLKYLVNTVRALTERAERAERDAEYNEHACEVSNRMLTATKVAAEHRIEERDPVRRTGPRKRSRSSIPWPTPRVRLHARILNPVDSYKGF